MSLRITRPTQPTSHERWRALERAGVRGNRAAAAPVVEKKTAREWAKHFAALLGVRVSPREDYSPPDAYAAGVKAQRELESTPESRAQDRYREQ